MKLTPYQKLITMTKEAVDKSLAPLRARTQRKRAELEVLKLEEKLQKLENDITEACSVKELDFDRILDLQNQHRLTELRLTQFGDVIAQLFPENA